MKGIIHGREKERYPRKVYDRPDGRKRGRKDMLGIKKENYLKLLFLSLLSLSACGGGGGGANEGTGSGAGGNATVSMVWYANTESDLGGYKVYYGPASRSYEHSQDVGIATHEGDNVYYELTGLSNAQTYFIAVTAYDIFGNESDFSNEIIAVPN